MGSTNIIWTETVDLYAADGTTLLVSSVPAYVELASANSRVVLQDVSHSTVAQLWTGIEQKGAVADGTRIFRTVSENWWTVRGMPRVFEGIGDEHLEATISAETPDAFFSSLAKPKALMMTFESIATATEMQLEISELPRFQHNGYQRTVFGRSDGLVLRDGRSLDGDSVIGLALSVETNARLFHFGTEPAQEIFPALDARCEWQSADGTGDAGCSIRSESGGR